MAKKVKYASIPRGDDKKAIASLTSIAETLIGAKGDKLEKAVTFRDLQQLDVIEIRQSLNGQQISLNNPSTGGGDTSVTVEAPTIPVDFALIDGFTTIILSWGYPDYQGHAYTEIWRSEDNVLGNADLLISTTNISFSDIVGNSFTGYYWVRHVNVNDVKGPYNATSGLLGQTADDIEFNISQLAGRIERVHLNSLLNADVDLGKIAKDQADAQLALIQGLDADLDSANLAIDSAQDRITDAETRMTEAENELTAFKSDTNSDIEGVQLTISNLVDTVDADRTTTAQGFVDIGDQVTVIEDDLSQNVQAVSLIDNVVNDPSTGLPATRSLLLNSYSSTSDTNQVINQAIDTVESKVFAADGTTVSTAFATAVDTSMVNANTSIVLSINTLSSEIDDPATGLAATRSELETSYYTRTETDQAIAEADVTFSANFDELRDDLAAVEADLEVNYYTSAETDQAISSLNTSLSAVINDPVTGLPATRADLSNNYYTITQADQAISNASTSLNSRIDGVEGDISDLDGALSQDILNVSANLDANYYTIAEADNAISISTLQLQSKIFDADGTTIKNAFTTSIDSAISNSSGSIATSINQLEATVDNPTTGLAATRATVNNNYQAVVNDTGDIISNHIASYAVTVDGQTNTLDQWAEVAADADGNFNAQWGVKTDVNNLQGGVGFFNNGTVTQFTVSADVFTVLNPQTDEVTQLLTTITNDPVIPDGVYIDTAFIKAATIQDLVAGDIVADSVQAGIEINSPVINGGIVRSGRFEAAGAGYMDITDPDGIGPDNLVRYFGPKFLDVNDDVIEASINKANAKIWWDINGGTNQLTTSADYIKNSGETTLLSLNPTLVIGNGSSAGNNRQLIIAMSWETDKFSSVSSTNQFGTTVTSNSAGLVTVQRSINGGSWTTLITFGLSYTYTREVSPEGNEVLIEERETGGGSVSTTDTVQTTGTVNYRAVVTSQDRYMTGNPDTQVLSLVSTEEL